MKQLQREVGITFIYVTHDQGEALAMSDRLAVMADGRLEQVGTPEEVYSRPATRFVAGFIGKANLLECTVVPADGGSASTAGPFVLDLPERHEPGRAIVSIRYEAIAVSPAPADSGEPAPERARTRRRVPRRRPRIDPRRRRTRLSSRASPVPRATSFVAGDRVGLSIDTSNVSIIRE